MLDDSYCYTCTCIAMVLSNADREKERASKREREKVSRRDIKFKKFINMCYYLKREKIKLKQVHECTVIFTTCLQCSN